MTNIQRDIFPTRGAISTAAPQHALPTINQTGSKFTTTTFTAGTDFTVPAGAASASVKIQLPDAPILGAFGRTGRFGDTSIVLGGALATTLTTQVAFISDAANLGGDVTMLTDGQYMVDHEAGIIYGKRVDTGTTGTVAYSYWASEGEVVLTGSVAVSSVIPGTGATNLGKAQDSAVGATDTGVGQLSKRVDTLATVTPVAGDYVFDQVDSTGAKWTREGYAAGAELNGTGEGVIATHSKGMSSSTGAYTYDFSGALEASTASKALPGRFYRTRGRIDSTAPSATYYWHTGNYASLPADGAVTLLIAPEKIVHTTGTNTPFDINWDDGGVYGSVGVTSWLSSTEFTKTISGAYSSTTIKVF